MAAVPRMQVLVDAYVALLEGGGLTHLPPSILTTPHSTTHTANTAGRTHGSALDQAAHGPHVLLEFIAAMVAEGRAVVQPHAAMQVLQHLARGTTRGRSQASTHGSPNGGSAKLAQSSNISSSSRSSIFAPAGNAVSVLSVGSSSVLTASLEPAAEEGLFLRVVEAVGLPSALDQRQGQGNAGQQGGERDELCLSLQVRENKHRMSNGLMECECGAACWQVCFWLSPSCMHLVTFCTVGRLRKLQPGARSQRAPPAKHV